jgi:hypothetical protein
MRARERERGTFEDWGSGRAVEVGNGWARGMPLPLSSIIFCCAIRPQFIQS